jgi:hypothetical protein
MIKYVVGNKMSRGRMSIVRIAAKKKGTHAHYEFNQFIKSILNGHAITWLSKYCVFILLIISNILS